MEKQELEAAVAALFGCFSKETFQADWRDTRDPGTLEQFEQWLRENAARIEAIKNPSPEDLELLQQAWERSRDNGEPAP